MNKTYYVGEMSAGFISLMRRETDGISIKSCLVDARFGRTSEAEQEARDIVRACNNHYSLLEALKYARRFLKPEDVDTDFIDKAIKKAES